MNDDEYVKHHKGRHYHILSGKQYKKEDVVWLPMRQLSTRDKNNTDINNYRSPYGLQQCSALSAIKGPDMTMYNNSNEKTNGVIYIKKKKMNETQICNT